MSKHISEIEQVLSKFPRRTSAFHPETYIGGGQSQLRYIGLRVPELSEAMKQGFSFSGGSEAEISKVWDEVWQRSDCFEVMALALTWFYHPQRRSTLKGYWPRLKKWSGKIDNWAHADTLSAIYARILEDDPQLVYPTLVQWNSAKNPWLRRLSIVSLLCYSSQRERVLPLKKILALVRPLLKDDHMYVQKGVGWTLRECGNVYPEKTYEFLQKHLHDLSAIAFSSATEKIKGLRKETLKSQRKSHRKIQRAKKKS